MVSKSRLRIMIATILAVMLSVIALPSWALTAELEFQRFTSDLVADAEHDAFGYSVDTDGSAWIIGARDDDIDGAYSGSVFVYSRVYSREKREWEWTPSIRLRSPDDNPSWNQYGWSVAYDSNIAVVGAPGALAAQGRAYVYQRTYDYIDGYSWRLKAVLQASDRLPADQFGISVDIDGDAIIVGANLNGGGAVYYFSVSALTASTDPNANPQTEYAKLVASDAALAGDHFGQSVAVQGDTIIIGAPFDYNEKGANAGAAYFYSVSQLVQGQTNTELYKAVASDGNGDDHFGSDVAVYGDIAIIGSPGDDSKAINSGAIYLFEVSGASWTETAKISNPETLGTAGDHFGNAVAIDGNRAVIGAYRDDATAEAVQSGAAYLFVRDDAGNWQNHDQMTDASDTSKGLDYFGWSVAIHGDKVLIGAPEDEDKADGAGSAHFFNLVVKDYDGDNIEDGLDNCEFIWNPDQTNTDEGFLLGDGLGDACDPDDDADAVDDDGDDSGSTDDNRCTTFNIFNCDDNCRVIQNSDQVDSDIDGVGDACDNCPSHINFNQSDIDSDGIGDICDDDKDGDGVDNPDDNCPANHNPYQTDTDGDGIGDACDPSLDEDGDGVLDGADNCPLTPNTDQTDSDSDGYGDACDADDDNDTIDDTVDNCPLTPNPNQDDLDGDLVGDACDADIDGDGVANDVDNCPTAANPGQLDSDLDGIGNVCDADDDNDGVDDVVDNCPLNANPGQENADGDAQGDVCDPDDDNDGILDTVDNCPLIANTNQADADADGIGDVCDPDDDNDGVDDGIDNCPVVANPDQSDADGDGLGDVCDNDLDGDGVANDVDNCPANPNPYQEDLDGDGVGDVCDNDIDGDGYLNAYDNCPLHVNPDQTDVDNDGIGDVCDPDDDNDGVADGSDNCPYIANPDQSDFDGDGYGDACDDDVDGDGVANVADLCAYTPQGAVVDAASGCSLAQLCPCDGPRGSTVAWRSHGKYVSCITHTVEVFFDQGLLTETSKGAIVSEAATSSCGAKK